MGKTSRQQIIETAERLILETDSPEVSLTQISSALGITHGALYKHFQNKQALWTAVAIDWFNREIINKIS
ncbi:TetR/AcrR family transcriptional regulator, partial [Streptomyces brasiliscabiei]